MGPYQISRPHGVYSHTDDVISSSIGQVAWQGHTVHVIPTKTKSEQRVYRTPVAMTDGPISFSALLRSHQLHSGKRNRKLNCQLEPPHFGASRGTFVIEVSLTGVPSSARRAVTPEAPSGSEAATTPPRRLTCRPTHPCRLPQLDTVQTTDYSYCTNGQHGTAKAINTTLNSLGNRL